MADPTRQVLDGNVGFFWPQANSGVADLDDEGVVRGYIHQSEDSLIEIRALDETPDLPGLIDGTSRSETVALFGSVEETGLLVPELLSAGHTTHFGSSRASVLRYRTRTLLTGVDLTQVKSSRINEASLTFGDGLTFAGMSVLSEKFKTDPVTHLLTEATFTLKSTTPSMRGGKYGAFALSLEADWSTSGKGATRTLNTGVRIVLSVARPRLFSDFRPLLLGIQDLLNLAYDRFIPAEGGRAIVDGGAAHGERSYLWLEDTMVSPPHTKRSHSPRDVRPLFTLRDIGGSSGLRRWLQLREAFPDAALAVASGHRDGGSRQPTRLLEIAAAIEYYVNANRRAGAKWAKKSKNAPTQAEALARRVGQPFASLTGDHHKWAERFVNTYNAVKHDPSFQRDPEELQLLSWSGQVLLLTALLDRAALSKAPSRRILSDYRVARGGEGLRTVLGS